MRITVAACALFLFCSFWSGAASAAGSTDTPQWKLGATDRVRLEIWDWFDPGPLPVGNQSSYSFVGNLLKLTAARTDRRRDSFVEISVPALIGLPDDAVAPGSAGQLGLGGTYRAVNGGQEFSVILRQAHVTFHDVLDEHTSLRLGRFEFVEGLEKMTKDPTLDWLKRERVAHRLIGNFGFSHVQRSFDGASLTHAQERDVVTAVAIRPTAGVFDLDGNQELEDIDVGYVGWTHTDPARKSDARLFLIGYDDERNVLKTDNRPLAARRADLEDVSVGTVGGHYLHRIGDVDLLAWGAWQRGDWGRLDHEAWAFAGEIGWQPRGTCWKPWIRAGLDRSSGDSDPGDGRHGTFFAVLPTPRLYSRFPFYNLMNVRDAFLQVLLRPDTRWTIRADYHDLDLSRAADLWYAGGGAFQEASFGYTGRPSGGSRDLARLADISVDWKASERTSVMAYVSRAFGGNVIRSIYPADAHGSFSCLELNHRF